MTIWQIAAGDGPERDYADPVFLRYGVAAVGPGDPGPYDPDDLGEYEDWAYRGFLRPFCGEVARDDLLILKRPRTRSDWEIVALGCVTKPYAYEDGLDDVEGWDLRHVVRVRWRVPTKPKIVQGLRRGTLSRVNKAELQRLARRLWQQNEANERKAEPLPVPPPPLSDDDFIAQLIDHGVSSTVAESTAGTVRRLRRLAEWYSQQFEGIGEHEIRAFLVVPLLLALGWPEQRMRIEYDHADVALWDRPFNRDDAQVERIVETKRLWNALGPSPIQQAAGYARRYPNCRSLLVADGFRYKAFTRGSPRRAGKVGWDPAAYANLLKLRAQHPLDPRVGGAGDLFLGLLPW